MNMKVELIKESSIESDEWFSIYVNGCYKTGSSNEFKIKKIYSQIIDDPSLLENKKEILCSAEFVVASEHNK